MKYLKLFEDFDILKDSMLLEQINPGKVNKTALFKWMPYNSQKDNPIQSSMPQDEITWNDLLNLISESEKNGTIKDIETAGLFMSHEKFVEGGFIRTIIKSFSPLKLDIAIFDDNYTLKSEFLDINPNEVDIKKVSKGASILTRSGLFDSDEINLKNR